MADTIAVEVTYALPHRQWLISLQVAAGSTVAAVIEQSQLLKQVPGLVIDDHQVGIFAQPCTLSHRVNPGDRVEIYRPLLCDPKELRRRRAHAALKAS